MSSYTDHIRILGVVLLYWVVSISLVFANKLLMPKSDVSHPQPIRVSIDAPIFVTWFQCALTAAIIYVLGLLSAQAKSDSWLKEFPQVSLNGNNMMKVAPLSLMFLGMITFNNLCLKYVTVAFYNVARSLTIVTNVIFTFILLGDATSLRVCATLLIVIVGFYVGIEGEIDFSWLGTIFGVASSCFVSLNAIYTKKTMPLVDNDKWKLSWYNNVNAAILFIPLIFLSGEHRTLIRDQDILQSANYWFIMTIAGVLGFAIGIVTVMQINYTSPLTHNISGTVKACVQTLLAIWLFTDPWTVKGLSGIMLTIFGSLIYAIVKMKENDSAKSAPSHYLPVKTDTKFIVEEEDDADLVEAGRVNLNINGNGHLK